MHFQLVVKESFVKHGANYVSTTVFGHRRSTKYFVQRVLTLCCSIANLKHIKENPFLVYAKLDAKKPLLGFMSFAQFFSFAVFSLQVIEEQFSKLNISSCITQP